MSHFFFLNDINYGNIRVWREVLSGQLKPMFKGNLFPASLVPDPRLKRLRVQLYSGLRRDVVIDGKYSD